MTTYTFDHATPATLEPYARFMEASANLAALQERLADGRLSYTHLRQMHSDRGLEGVWINGPGPVIVPRVRLELEAAGLHALAEHVMRAAPDKRVILTEGAAPLASAPWAAAGWTRDTHAVIAQTDLTARRWPLDPRVQERPVSDLLSGDLLALYAALVEVGTIGDTGEIDPAIAFAEDVQDEEQRLFVLVEHGTVLGAALLTPAPPGTRGIHLLGIRPDRRGAGLGRALHAHLLAVAAQTHQRHGGTTEWDNHAMRRIFERNGAVLREQQQFIRGV
ncbi:GNAT family N-acetyltransferase [Deinococcus sonorensis]|uniref:GNAT family N-acetyltransferase n=2 Tax=Deinococcus sonorensis TaxID=309891 RepID=A0AAU7U619_9DEIO